MIRIFKKFKELLDVKDSWATSAGKFWRTKSDGSGLEAVSIAIPASGEVEFLLPADYSSGQTPENPYIAGSNDENIIEFAPGGTYFLKLPYPNALGDHYTINLHTGLAVAVYVFTANGWGTLTTGQHALSYLGQPIVGATGYVFGKQKHISFDHFSNDGWSPSGSLGILFNHFDTTEDGWGNDVVVASGVAQRYSLSKPQYDTLTGNTDASSLHNHDSAYATTIGAIYRGCLTLPSYTNNANGSITLGDQVVSIYDNAGYVGLPKLYTVTGGTFTFVDNTTSYLSATYNAGSPILEVVTNVTLFEGGDHAPLFTVYRTGNVLNITNWDTIGAGLSEKIMYAAARTMRYTREYGLSISEYGTRNIKLTAGKVYVALSVPVLLAEINTATNNFTLYNHVAGVWTASTQTAYNNTQYDNGTDLVTLGTGRYAVSWVYRGIEDATRLYATMGTGDYTLNQAEAAQPPTPPTQIAQHTMLVGKIIVQKNAETATAISSAFASSFVTETPSNHADLTNLGYTDSGHTGFEPTITTGTTSQYLRGDKSLATFATDALAAAPAETSATVATIAHGTAAKTTLADADEVTGCDSAGSFSLIRTTWANVKAFLKTYFDALYLGKTADVITETGTTTTVLTSWNGKRVRFTSATAVTLTIPATTGFTSGFQCSMFNDSANAIDVSFSGTVVASGTKIAQKKGATLRMDDVFRATGGLS